MSSVPVLAKVVIIPVVEFLYRKYNNQCEIKTEAVWEDAKKRQKLNFVQQKRRLNNRKQSRINSRSKIRRNKIRDMLVLVLYYQR